MAVNIIVRDPEILGGTPCFRGTRVPFQNLTGRVISVAIIRARSNRLPDLLPKVPAILAALPLLKPGEVTEIS